MLIILRDTKEQEVLSFDHCEGIDKVEDIGLLYGDYSAMIDGQQVPVFFERKAMGDLFSTMTHGYERFKKEMARAKGHGHKLILITEGTYSDVKEGYSHSEYSGESMVKKLHMLEVKYDLAWWPCESRRVMTERIYETFSAIKRMWEKHG